MSHLLLAASLAVALAAAAGAADFDRDIRPILAEHCYACHGPDARTRQAGLRLDSRDGLLDRAVVVPGQPEDSELFRRITAADPARRMPEPKSGKSLAPRQIALMREWIAQGARWADHWSYRPPSRPEAPDAPAPHPIDRFVLAKLATIPLEPAPPADRVTLIRRLSLDLTGLPPAVEEVRHFATDESPDAYAKLVDRLLAAPQYGERMAMFWLDLVRYADTIGYNNDNPMNVWAYRDWVIKAFNDNMRFDRFTAEQLAGDLLPGAGLEQRIASAYNRLLMTTEEGGAQAREYEAKYAADRVRNLSAVWLGSTLACCQCHDHKFDPFTTRDFYRTAAFFADVQEAGEGPREHGLLLAGELERAELARRDARIAELKARLAAAREQSVMDELAAEKKARIEYERSLPAVLVTTSGPPREVRVLRGGDWLDRTGEVVTPAVPVSLGALEVKGRRATRLDLAAWLTAKENPLTARVLVNRLWALFFGRGLVRTMEDLGSQGERPTHPELLDWLAVELRESGWDVKHLIRILVSSNAYRRSSQPSAAQRERDPDNRWLARQSRFRFPAETVRDNALAISGLLERRIGGPSVKPYQPAGFWDALTFPARTYVADTGPDQYRRGLYTHWQRTFLHPSLQAFDAPTREECTAERARSNIPQQAMVLLNDPTFVEAARVFAERILKEGGPTTPERLAWAFEHALSRKPAGDELRVLAALVDRHGRHYGAAGDAARQLVAIGQRPPAPDLDPAELAAWTSAARVLFNLSETITRN